ncbi:MAG: translation initiation factor IF-2 [Candidatus Omnitrophica bacterium]|nr:translation initiation factor IF-2 [Candidatus Omnitrophota bacterium]
MAVKRKGMEYMTEVKKEKIKAVKKTTAEKTSKVRINKGAAEKKAAVLKEKPVKEARAKRVHAKKEESAPVVFKKEPVSHKAVKSRRKAGVPKIAGTFTPVEGHTAAPASHAQEVLPRAAAVEMPVKAASDVTPKTGNIRERPVVIPPPVSPVPAAQVSAVSSVTPAAKEEKPAVPAVSVVSAPVSAAVSEAKELELEFPVVVKDLAVKLQEKPSILIKLLMGMGVMATINQALDEVAANKICGKYGFKIKQAPNQEELALVAHKQQDKPEELVMRAPIVTFMGHVDHGKTSLLDAIRKSKVVDSEFGGITQHIGAYRIAVSHGEITFLDTPGHEAFTAMRARGAKATDIVILVVAADDGIMPQTREAVDHARAAGVTIVVAINKIDKPQADLNRVKKQLAELNLAAEDWGGKTITVPVSAKTGEGIDDLLEMIILETEMLELKANPNRPANGIVLEAKMVKNKGPVATLLVQSGTLRLNNNIIVGQYFGKIRAMFNDRGHSITEAGPSLPVEVLGISGLPEAGEQFFAIEEEKTAKELALKRRESERDRQIKPVKRLGLEDLYAQIKEGKLKELKLILKADAQGSLEAIEDIMGHINVPGIKISIIHEGVGNINISDVMLGLASEALILGFNIEADDAAKELALKEGQDVQIYNIIYELTNEIKAALEGMLEPKLKKVFLGKAEVKKVFRLSTSGVIAGCMVSKGRIVRSSPVRIVRNGQQIYEGGLSSLKRFKDDVREVEEGFECGMSLKGFDGILEGDVVEAYEIKKIARTLADVERNE